MKKSFRTLFLSVVIAAVPLFHTTIHAQTTYSTDYETESSYSWASLVNTDKAGDATTDWAEVVTKAYGANAENKAVAIKSGADYLAERGAFDTLAYGTVVDNPIIGNCVLSFDFMPDSAVLANLGDWEMIKSVFVQTTSTGGSAEQNVCNYLKYSNGRGVAVCLPDSSNTQLGLVPNDTWSRVKIEYSPKTGKAIYTLIKNIDTAPELVSVTEYQLTTAGAKTGVDRLKLNVLQSNSKFYYDNVSLSECEGVKLVSASPVSGAEAPADGGITLLFSGKVESHSFTLNGVAVTFDADETKTMLTYSGDMIANREYTLIGTVTDENGLPYQISHSFKTAPELKLLSATAKNGDTGITPTDKLVFEFNHRIDPCDNSFSITGGAEIESYNVKGNVLEIKLSEVLEYDRYYTVKLEGLGDLYSEEYSETEITFKTAGLDVNYAKFVDGNGESLSVIDSANTRYTAEFINNTPILQNIIFVMTLSENDKIKEIVFEPYTVNPGEKLSIDEGFTGINTEAGDYQIKVFYLDGLDTLSPYDTQMLPIVTIGEQSEE